MSCSKEERVGGAVANQKSEPAGPRGTVPKMGMPSDSLFAMSLSTAETLAEEAIP